MRPVVIKIERKPADFRESGYFAAGAGLGAGCNLAAKKKPKGKPKSKRWPKY